MIRHIFDLAARLVQWWMVAALGLGSATAGATPMDWLGAPPPLVDDATYVYEARTGLWFEVDPRAVFGEEIIHEGRLYRIVGDELVDRGPAHIDFIMVADEVYDPSAPSTTPHEDSWVLVLGDGPQAGHFRLKDIPDGARFAHAGRVFSSRRGPGGTLQMKPTGNVLSRVTATHQRHSPVLLDLVLQHADGGTSVVSATPEHPFFLPEKNVYVPASQLVEGAALRTESGERAVLTEVRTREGGFDVYNIDVAGTDNYFVGSDPVAVHNVSCAPKSAHARACELHALLPFWQRIFRTTAVMDTLEGKRLITSSTGYLSRKQQAALLPNEVYVRGSFLRGHAEVRLWDYATYNKYHPTEVAANWKICKNCQKHFCGTGIRLSGPLK